jgi:hypothetical protein
MASAKPATRVAYRSSVDGQFITKKEAMKNPRESERQHIPLPPAPKKGK